MNQEIPAGRKEDLLMVSRKDFLRLVAFDLDFEDYMRLLRQAGNSTRDVQEPLVLCFIYLSLFYIGASGKEPACQFRRHKRCGFDPWIGKIPWRRAWQPTPVFLPGEPHKQRSPVEPWWAESDETEVT